MPVKIHRIPALALFSLGALAGVLLVSMMLFPTLQSQALSLQNNYGKALSAMTAKQAIDASFNHDLVRLQIILRDVVSNPHLAQATIHDVENNLLVQAGEVRPNNENHTAYTAPIVLHDSIAGYVTITLENYNNKYQSASWLIFLLSLVLASTTAIALYRDKSIQWEARQNIRPDSPEENAEAALSTLIGESPVTTNDEDAVKVYAIIHIKNLDVLKQQLNGGTFRNTINILEEVIADVLALYNGREHSADEKFYTLSFDAADAANEAIFRASCCAYLIVELASIINRIPLDLAAFVSANEEDLIPAKLPVAGLVLETQAAQDELIKRRLNFMEVGAEDGRMIVADFEQPFKSLLENQRKHLSKMAAR